MMTNERPIREIPPYLRTYIVEQDATLYTPMDHASWRFILKIARVFFARHAHQNYLDGLKETGISTERIPLIEEMDECLGKFGWRAVAVSGFIPPSVFMEYLSLGILPIACDMRQIDHLSYTPAPDIVHEAAGHAPILADPEFAAYLRHYGEISRKAIYSSQDLDVYEAVRELSDIKEDPASTPQTIQKSQEKFERALASISYVSEASELARMAWWTFEYGLIGDFSDPKIYGAGLLSSVSESYHCFDPSVRKVPLTVDCIKTAYDITRPQPQLFVAPNFKSLVGVLEELSHTMAYKQGGKAGLDKAIRARTTTTCELDSGVQFSGMLASYLLDVKGQPAYLKLTGPSQIAYQDIELEGQGCARHVHGFGTPVGVLKHLATSPAELTNEDLAKLGFLPGKKSKLEFESGVVVEGELTLREVRDGRNLLLTFQSCTVKLGDELLFDPAWGVYDMACGGSVQSVFGGAADRAKYLEATGGFKQPPGRQKSNLTDSNKELNDLYAQVRKIRESTPPGLMTQGLIDVFSKLEASYPDDWLLRYELLELNFTHRLRASWVDAAQKRLDTIAASSKDKAELISRGLAALRDLP